MSFPKVTIMIPTYGQESFIERAVQSALAQDYENLEIIVSDDCSPDNTEGVIEPLLSSKKLKYIKRQKNLGRVGNYRKTLYEDASGEWVINLDGDDFFKDSSFISKAIKLVKDHPELELVFANRSEVYNLNGVEKEYLGNVKNYPELIDGDDIFLNYPYGKYFVHHLTTLYKREIAMKIGFYRYDITSADLESLLRYFPGRKVGFLKDVVACWRRHDENESKDLNIEKRMNNLKAAQAPYEYLLEKGFYNQKVLLKWRDDMLYRIAYAFVSNCLEAKEISTAWSFIKTFSSNHPGMMRRFFFDKKVIFRLLFPGKLDKLKAVLKS